MRAREQMVSVGGETRGRHVLEARQGDVRRPQAGLRNSVAKLSGVSSLPLSPLTLPYPHRVFLSVAPSLLIPVIKRSMMRVSMGSLPPALSSFTRPVAC